MFSLCLFSLSWVPYSLHCDIHNTKFQVIEKMGEVLTSKTSQTQLSNNNNDIYYLDDLTRAVIKTLRTSQ